jgi:hypothetical protein
LRCFSPWRGSSTGRECGSGANQTARTAAPATQCNDVARIGQFRRFARSMNFGSTLRGTCAGSAPVDAKQLIGTDDRTLKDSTGNPFGQELFTAGQKPEGQVSEVSYLFPKPGPDKTPVQKVSFVTRVGDIYCGAGYYK